MYYSANKDEKKFVSIIIWEILFDRYDNTNIYICSPPFPHSNLSSHTIAAPTNQSSETPTTMLLAVGGSTN